jgi:hypothetical protein
MKSEVGGYAMAQDVSRRALMIQALRRIRPGGGRGIPSIAEGYHTV